MIRICDAMYTRGMASSTGGNVSMRRGDEIIITPTGISLSGLSPADLVRVGLDGSVVPPGRPSKELPFHLAVYRERPDVTCVIHGHSAVAVAASTLIDPDPVNAFPVYTAGYQARVGRLPLLPYYDSGSARLATAVGAAAKDDTKAVLLQNHGFIAIGPDVQTAYNTADELLDALRVYVLTNGNAKPLHDALEWRAAALASRKAGA
jgi:3-dehydro-4-phosphotetronate decarboxylase